MCGTPLYQAPEIWNNQPYNQKVDIWALGIILYEMVTQQYPFNGGTLYGLAYSIINGDYPYIPPRVSP